MTKLADAVQGANLDASATPERLVIHWCENAKGNPDIFVPAYVTFDAYTVKHGFTECCRHGGAARKTHAHKQNMRRTTRPASSHILKGCSSHSFMEQPLGIL